MATEGAVTFLVVIGLCWLGLAGLARRATYFSLLRQRNLRKRKPTRSLGPLRFATGQPALHQQSGGPRKLACGSNSARPWSRFAGAAQAQPERVLEAESGSKTRMARSAYSAVGIGLLPDPPLLYALRSGSPDGSGLVFV